MIFNEKALIRHMKIALKNGNLIYGQIGELIVFGGTTWRGCIDEEFMTQGIYGEMLKTTGVFPRPGEVFTINKEKIAQYTFTDIGEFKGGDEEDLIVTKIIYAGDRRILKGKDGLMEVYEGHVNMLDQSAVTDEEDKFTGPFYDVLRGCVFWHNDTCALKVYDQYQNEDRPELLYFSKIENELEVETRYTFH